MSEMPKKIRIWSRHYIVADIDGVKNNQIADCLNADYAKRFVRRWNAHERLVDYNEGSQEKQIKLLAKMASLLAACESAEKALKVAANYLCERGRQPTPEEMADAIVDLKQAIAKAKPEKPKEKQG